MATTAELPKNNTPEMDDSFHAELHAAGLENLLPSTVQEWAFSTEVAREQIARLAGLGFGDAIRNLSPGETRASQAMLVEAFVDAFKDRNRNTVDQPLRGNEGTKDFQPNISNSPADSEKAQPVASKVGSKASRVAQTVDDPALVVPPRASRPNQQPVAPDQPEKNDEAKKSRWQRWGKKALAAVIAAGTLGSGLGAWIAIDSNKNMHDKTSLSIDVATKAAQTGMEANNSNEFFNQQDPTDLPKEAENNFGPKSQAGLDGDRQGIIRDYEALFHGEKSGAYILTDKAAFMQHVTGATFELPDGVTAPTFPGVDAMRNKSVYDAYEQQSQAFADYLRQHPDVAKQLNDAVIKTITEAQMSDVQYTAQTVASNYIDHNTHKLYWDLSVNEGANGAPYRMWTITINGRTGEMGDMLACDYQNFEINAMPLKTIRPTEEFQPAEVTSIPTESPTLVPVDTTPQPETPTPTPTSETPSTPETPSAPTPPSTPTPTPTPTPLASKGDEYLRHPSLTTNLGSGDLKPAGQVATTETTTTGRQIGTNITEAPVPDNVLVAPSTKSGAQSHDAGVNPTTKTVDTSANKHSGSGIQISATKSTKNTAAVSGR